MEAPQEPSRRRGSDSSRELASEFRFELDKRFEGEIRTDLATRILYSTDASIYQIEPLGAAFPKTVDDLQAAVEQAARFRVPILPRGSGSSLGGQAVGPSLILDCSRHLDRIHGIDAEAHTAWVEPGVILADLNRQAAVSGLMFGPDPASAERATMGGVIGNNATGAHSIRYGMSADHLRAAEVILGDGSLETWDAGFHSRLSGLAAEIRSRHAESIRRSFPRTWRNSAGYRLNYLIPWSPSRPPQWDEQDFGMPASVYRETARPNLAALLAGSEGTLAVARRLQVNLVPRPKHTILALIGYPDLGAACADVPRLLEHRPSAIELIPQMIIRLARAVPAYARQMDWLKGDPAAVLVVEFSGDEPQALRDSVNRVGPVFRIAESAADQARVWNVRKMGLGILDSRPRAARPVAFIEDCAVPVGHLAGFVRDVERILADHGTVGGIYAHASAGCLHIRPLLDLQQGRGVEALRSIAAQVFALTMRLGGAMSSEHGDGIVAGEWIEKTYGDELTALMRRVKRAADPHNLLNPGKMFDAPPMDTHLRYGVDYRADPWPAALAFPHERGLAGAIEQCNGQGVCRKTSGVMCPSFQATREESNSTRGRANLLRALIRSGGSPAAGASSGPGPGIERAVFEALDLCLACKGCTSECPSGVDMPRLKYEFMNRYYRNRLRPLRDYLFGYFHWVARMVQPVHALVNVLTRTQGLHKIIARILGVTDRRPFPVFSSGKARVVEPQGSAGAVIFLSDVFSRYLEPEVEQAAFDILAAAGFEVRVLSRIGAGTSLLSKGFIQAARRHAAALLDEVRMVDGGRGLFLVGCEPPEVYCIKREYSALLPDRSRDLEGLLPRVFLLEEFLLRGGVLERLRAASPGSSKSFDSNRIPAVHKVTFHPHCHQRAEGPADDGLPIGVPATVELLKAAGFEVDVVDDGCCGMAGTFGYDAEHYQLSMRVGELGLLPELRALLKQDPQACVASSGSACRMQIQQSMAIKPIHPLILVRDRLLGR